LPRQNARLSEYLREAHVITDVQKKVAGLLGHPLANEDPERESRLHLPVYYTRTSYRMWLSGPSVCTNWKTISGRLMVSLTDEEQVAIAEVSKIPAEYPAWMIELWSQLRRTQLANSRR
jgi:hypothetical protein